jgi:hypothetical protein
MQNYFILWHGVDEWEEFNGTLEDAIKHIKSDARYKNYGHQGAMVIASSIHYEIAVDGTEYHKEAAEKKASPKQSKPRKHRCKGCGYKIHPSETYCGECVCEDDSE